jgi:hypothetical protein
MALKLKLELQYRINYSTLKSESRQFRLFRISQNSCSLFRRNSLITRGFKKSLCTILINFQKLQKKICKLRLNDFISTPFQKQGYQIKHCNCWFMYSGVKIWRKKAPATNNAVLSSCLIQLHLEHNTYFTALQSCVSYPIFLILSPNRICDLSVYYTSNVRNISEHDTMCRMTTRHQYLLWPDLVFGRVR